MAAEFKHYVAYEDWTAVEGDPVSSSRARGPLSFWDVDLANQSPWSYIDRCARRSSLEFEFCWARNRRLRVVLVIDSMC